jgi:hypothetical protein
MQRQRFRLAFLRTSRRKLPHRTADEHALVALASDNAGPLGALSLAFGKGIRTVCLERTCTQRLIERADFTASSARRSYGLSLPELGPFLAGEVRYLGERKRRPTEAALILAAVVRP